MCIVEQCNEFLISRASNSKAAIFIIILVGDERGSGFLKFSGCGSGSASVRCLGGTHHRHPPTHGRTLCFLARSPIALVSPFSLSLQYILFVTTRKIKNLKFMIVARKTTISSCCL